MSHNGTAVAPAGLDLGVEVEEGVDAEAQLGLDLLAAALEHVHGHAGLIAVLQLYRSVVDLDDLIRGQQTHSVHHYEICHAAILSPKCLHVLGG